MLFNNMTGSLPETLSKLTTLKVLGLGPMSLLPGDDAKGLSGETYT